MRMKEKELTGLFTRTSQSIHLADAEWNQYNERIHPVQSLPTTAGRDGDRVGLPDGTVYVSVQGTWKQITN